MVEISVGPVGVGARAGEDRVSNFERSLRQRLL